MTSIIRLTAFALFLVGLSALPSTAQDETASRSDFADLPANETPTHVEVEPISIELGETGKIETMAMDNQGNLLLGTSWKSDVPAPQAEAPAEPRRRGRPPFAQDATNREYAIKVVSQQGKLLETKPMGELAPKMIHGCEDGQVYVMGSHQLVRYDAKGKQLNRIKFADMLGGEYADYHASGITVCDDYVFVALGDGFSLRAVEDIVRLDRDLSSAKLVVERQFGCCAHIDLDVQGDVLLIAENSRHRVGRFSFDGEKINTWGGRSRTSIEGFAACCNPVNFDFGPEGVLYTAESGVGRVKKYTAEGEYLGLVGYVDTTKFDRGSRLAAMSCYIPVEVSADGSKVFVQDVRANIIRVLEEKR